MATSSDTEPLGLPGGARIGATFRLLMQVRILTAAAALFLLENDEHTVTVFFVFSFIGVLSAVALLGWDEILPWLRRYPILIVSDAFVAFAAMAVGGVLGPFFLFTVVTSAVAGLFFRWPGTLCFCLLQVAFYFLAALESGWIRSFQTAIGMPFFYFIGGFIGSALRRLFDEQARTYEALRRAQIVAAAADERARLARELHDSLAKTLRGISMSASALPMWIERSPGRAKREADRIVSAAEVASREARDLITELRDDTVRGPLATVVRDITEAWAAETGVTAEVSAVQELELDVLPRHELVAILREALENVKRHAEASAVEVTLGGDDRQIRLTVRDDGSGFAAPRDLTDLARAGHYGVVGMAERAAQVGAEISVKSTPGTGTTVTVVLPALAERSCLSKEVA